MPQKQGDRQHIELAIDSHAVERYRIPRELEGRMDASPSEFPASVLPRAHLVAVQLFALGGGLMTSWALASSGVPIWVSPLIFAIVGLLLVVRFGGSSLLDHVAARLPAPRRRSAKNLHVRTLKLPDGKPMALLSDGETISSVIEVRGGGKPISVGKVEPRSILSLSVLADSLDQYDIALESIDIVMSGSTGAPRAWVTIRFAPGLDRRAVERRGDDDTGAERALSTATRRLIQRLAGTGLHVEALDGKSIERTRSGIVGTDLKSWSASGASIASTERSGIVGTVSSLRAYTEVTNHPQATSLFSLRGHSRAGRVLWSAAVRMDTSSAPVKDQPPKGVIPSKINSVNLAKAIAPGAPSGLHSLRADQSDYRDVTAASPILDVPYQIVGTSAESQDVKLRFGPRHVKLLQVDASAYTGAQVILRAITNGIRVSVASSRPSYWEPFVRAFGDNGQRLFGIAGDKPREAANSPLDQGGIVVEDGINHPHRELAIAIISLGQTPAASSESPITGDSGVTARLAEEPTLPGSALLTYGGSRIELGLIYQPTEDWILGLYR